MNIKDLKQNPRNPRIISDDKLEALKGSILKYGDLSGFVVNLRTGNMISGHQRQKISPDDSKIKIEKKYEIPTASRTVAEGYILINGERFKYREVDANEAWEAEAMLAANKHGGEWDQSKLTDLFKIPHLDLKLTGFSIPELEAMNIPAPVFDPHPPDPVIESNSNDPDEVPEVTGGGPAICKPGDLWILGQHRLLCGDSTDKTQVERLMNGEKAEIVLTDPPYNVGLKYISYDDKVPAEKFQEHIRGWRTGMKQMSDRALVFPGNTTFLDWIIADRPNYVCCWTKKNGNSPCGVSVFNQWEPILLYGKNDRRKFGLASDVFDCHVKSGFLREEELDHPCPKPVELFTTLVSAFTNSGSIVAECFLGSGTTLIACEKTNRKCYGMEIDPHYCDVIVARWEKYTGLKAILDTPR